MTVKTFARVNPPGNLSSTYPETYPVSLEGKEKEITKQKRK